MSARFGRRPPVGPAPGFAAPIPTVFALSNSIPVWHLERRGLPLVSVRLGVRGGSASDPHGMGGLAALSDTLLTRGAGDRDALAFATLTERLALSLAAGTDEGHTVVHLDAETNRLATGLDLMADAALRPHLADDEIARIRAHRMGELAQELDDPTAVARLAASWTYFGHDHPCAHPARGVRSGVEAITPAAVRESWAHRFTADHAHLVVVGDLDAASARDVLEARFGGWAVGSHPRAPLHPPHPIPHGPALRFVDNPGATQSVLYVLGPGPAATDPMLHAARMATLALGGTFTSRLNQRLREEKGYTYGVQTRLEPAVPFSTCTTRTAVNAEATAPALQDLMGEVQRLRRGVRAEELHKARAARLTQLVAAFEPRGGAADALAALAQTGRGPTGFQDEVVAQAALTSGDVRVAARGLGLEHAVVVVVGDLASIRGPVEAAVPGHWVGLARDPWSGI